MLGRPSTTRPVISIKWPWGWLLCSVYIERTRQRSSARSPRCGRTSEISIPHWPRLVNFLCVASSVFDWLPVCCTSSLMEYCLPFSRVSSGLGSSTSIWLTPPC